MWLDARIVGMVTGDECIGGHEVYWWLRMPATWERSLETGTSRDVRWMPATWEWSVEPGAARDSFLGTFVIRIVVHPYRMWLNLWGILGKILVSVVAIFKNQSINIFENENVHTKINNYKSQ